MNSYLSLIKFSHTIFALPFAVIGAILGFKAGHPLTFLLLFKILLCMVFARSAAMAFNRWADSKYDGLNPRTANREIPAGIMSSTQVLWFVMLSCAAFIITTYFINSICFYLSPVALFTILGYSLTKRWTTLCHFILGIGLSLAPIGAYLAVTGQFALIPLLFSGIVFYWVSGFDIIYALQDEDFDKTNKLFSIPARFGKVNALKVSRLLHTICGLILIFATWRIQSSGIGADMLSWLAAAFFIVMLVYQHSLVSAVNLSKINMAFFTVNGLASLTYGVIMVISLLT